jgi:hypothetical protein
MLSWVLVSACHYLREFLLQRQDILHIASRLSRFLADRGVGSYRV